MSNLSPDQPPAENEVETRCPVCDSRVQAGDAICLMCGAPVPASLFAAAADKEVAADTAAAADADSSPVPTTVPAALPSLPAIIESQMRERQSRLSLLITLIIAAITIGLGAIVLQNPTPVTLALVPTSTPIPPTITHTPTWTPLPSETSPPTQPPTITPTPQPTTTPQPPLLITVAPGDTLFSLSFRYQVSIDSIALLNNLSPDNPLIRAEQQLAIPWPTPTPPLQPIQVQVGADTVLADPTNCERYEIQGNDTMVAIAVRYGVPLDALLAVNRLDVQSLIRPGDTVCIPAISYTEAELINTPGPSPTPGPTALPQGPRLLYPPQNAVITPPDGPVTLQWIAVKDLSESEWYMVEMLDLNAVDSHPRRAFTRQTSFQTPSTWRPEVPEERLIRWRVSIVQVTGKRSDGGFIYTYGGESSADGFFLWTGAVPTPTPTPTATPMPTPSAP